MSSTVDIPKAAGRVPVVRRRGQRLSRPAITLIAQGEPMVWLTGGAMIVCLAMIMGLMGLILWNGLPTFWPQPLLRLERVDGKVLLGEVTRVESFPVTQNTIRNLSGVEAEIATKLLAKSDSVTAERRMLRTGNFELTNEHFQWISDFAIERGGETKPEWAVLVERVEWGRFYGEPRRFTQRRERSIGADEAQLQQIVLFLESQQYRVSAEQADAFAKAIAVVNERLQSRRSKAVADFVGGLERPDGLDVALQFAEGDPVPLADWKPEPGKNVVAAQEIADGSAAAWQQFERHHDDVRESLIDQAEETEEGINEINERMEEARLTLRQVELTHDVAVLDVATQIRDAALAIQTIRQASAQTDALVKVIREQFAAHPELIQFANEFAAAQRTEIAEQIREPQERKRELEQSLAENAADVRKAVDEYVAMQLAADRDSSQIRLKMDELQKQRQRWELAMVTADGQEKPLTLLEIVRAYPANQLGLVGKFGVYLDRWSEFLTSEPREANSEGGVFPAIWGTVVMTLIMSVLVVPFGVLSALYLREYARAGFMVSAIRISISNLAGVPSIVFGVFGLGFFCYVFGAYLDGGPGNAGLSPLPSGTWFLALGGLAACGFAAFLCSFFNASDRRSQSLTLRRLLTTASLILWLACVVLAALLIFKSPFFDGFFRASLPNPTFGKGGLIWCALTLALLTLPVVIVATEEALAGVPNSLREGSYACGASKWQTIRRIVLPHAMPGIMTGMILAMARGAGEAAPLMLVGVVKLAPDLPIDGDFPYVHLDRSFMHLGFHVFDVGFQSQNSEAAKPMVYTTTLLLILIIASLNLAAIWVRSRLRKKYLGGQF